MECLNEQGNDACETTFKQFICSFTLIMTTIIHEFFKNLAKDLGIETVEDR